VQVNPPTAAKAMCTLMMSKIGVACKGCISSEKPG
jgi:hypothetical protein